MSRIVIEYHLGAGCTTLAKRNAISENAVLALLKREDVVIRRLGKLSESDVKKMHELRVEGWTFQAIGDRFGVTRVAVSRRLSQDGN